MVRHTLEILQRVSDHFMTLRGFSALKSLKTNIRSTSYNNWTNYLMIFDVHQEEIFVLILCSIVSKTSNKTEVKCYLVELK